MIARRPRPATPPPAVVPTPTTWARTLIAAAAAVGPIPAYGSPEWEALDDADPRKAAAAVVSAEVQRFEELTLADRLAREIAEARYQAEAEAVADEIEAGARAAIARDEFLARSAKQVGEAGARQLLGRRPTHAQLVELRAESSPTPVTTSPSSSRRWPPVAWPPATPGAEVVPAGRPGGGVPSVWVTMRQRSA